ncbi:MAG: phosphoenolpyruvate--protein phosphotransferase, partial [Acidobacteriota bacterium]|nr:phosphoenolpyruvate--protein phosphotransferase [Acidobacteriota bacterium]
RRQVSTSHRAMVTLAGTGVSGGIAIGRAVCIADAGDDVLRFQLADEEIETEMERFAQAQVSAVAELRKAQAEMGRVVGTDLAGILEAQAMLLEDRSFGGRITARIRGRQVNAEWAVLKECEELGERFAEAESEYLRERGEDLASVGRYLLSALQGVSHHELSEIEGDVVIVARELTPSDALRFARENVVGFALEAGGETSHATIIVRGLNLPAIVGLDGILELLTDRDPMVIDGERGEVVLHPRADTLAAYRGRAVRIEEREAALEETRLVPATTIDGVAVELLANLELLEEVADANRFGADGVGLYRSEFFFIEKSPEIPTEEEHYQLVVQVLESMAPRPVVMRTLDLGGRKLAQALLPGEEENPVLGLRGIRLTQAHPEILRPQLRAFFRAATRGNLGMMVPLVTSIEEIHEFRRLCRGVVAELESEGVEHRADVRLGAMIEVPAAALVADHLAAELDFLSIGTNDLIQYALAVDRNNERVATLYQPTHPAVLRLLQRIVEDVKGKGCELSMCGEMAADTLLTPFLVGLGLHRLSMSSRSIPLVKERVRGLSVAELGTTVEACLTCSTAEAVRNTLLAAHPLPELRA